MKTNPDKGIYVLDLVKPVKNADKVDERRPVLTHPITLEFVGRPDVEREFDQGFFFFLNESPSIFSSSFFLFGDKIRQHSSCFIVFRVY